MSVCVRVCVRVCVCVGGWVLGERAAVGDSVPNNKIVGGWDGIGDRISTSQYFDTAKWLPKLMQP